MIPMIGRLLTEDFLNEGIKRTDAYREFETRRPDRCIEEIKEIYDRLLLHKDPNEAVTEAELIHPVLMALGKLRGGSRYVPDTRSDPRVYEGSRCRQC